MVETRVMSAWNASRCRSKCSFTCSSNDSGTPAGITTPSVDMVPVAFLAMRQPPLQLSNVGFIFIQLGTVARTKSCLKLASLAVTESRMLRSCSRRAARSAATAARAEQAARTLLADRAPSAAAGWEWTRKWYSNRCSYSLRRSCSNSRPDLPAPVAATAAAIPARHAAR